MSYAVNSKLDKAASEGEIDFFGDIGIAVGTGYKLMKGQDWTVGVRYYQGLTNDFKFRSGTMHNSNHFKVNIAIGAGAPKEKKG